MRVEDQKKIMSQVNSEIDAMEKEELEILERLKNSQRLEQEANEGLK